MYSRKSVGPMYYPSFVDLNKFNVSLLQEEATEIESIDFVGCYTTQLKDDICAVTNTSVEISVHIYIFTPVKASFFLKEIQKSSLIEMAIQKI